MNNRETKTIKTQNGHEVLLATYITQREKRYIEEPIYNSMGATASGSEVTASGNVTGEVVREVEDRTIKTIVRAINGKTENILDELLELQHEDAQEILDALDEITGKKKAEASETQ